MKMNILPLYLLCKLWLNRMVSSTVHRVCNKRNMAVVTSGVATAYPAGAPAFPLVFSGVRVAQFVVFCVVFCRSLFVLFLLTICIVLFFDLRLQITHLVSLFFSEYEITHRRCVLCSKII